MSNRILIHKTGEEGSIQADARSGQIVTEVDQRPDWADGLAIARLADRVGWYEQRLGAHLTDEQRSPDIMAFEDLDFVGVDAEGDEVELDASREYRMEALAEMIGVDTDGEYDQPALTSDGFVEVAHRDTVNAEETLGEENAGQAEQGVAHAVNG